MVLDINSSAFNYFQNNKIYLKNIDFLHYSEIDWMILMHEIAHSIQKNKIGIKWKVELDASEITLKLLNECGIIVSRNIINRLNQNILIAAGYSANTIKRKLTFKNTLLNIDEI